MRHSSCPDLIWMSKRAVSFCRDGTGEPVFSDDDCRKILKEHFHVMSLEGLGLGDYENGMIASGAVLQYLYETQKNDLSHLTKITPYTTGQFMMIDTSTRRNLELVETLRENRREAPFSGSSIRQRRPWGETSPLLYRTAADRQDGDRAAGSRRSKS